MINRNMMLPDKKTKRKEIAARISNAAMSIPGKKTQGTRSPYLSKSHSELSNMRRAETDKNETKSKESTFAPVLMCVGAVMELVNS